MSSADPKKVPNGARKTDTATAKQPSSEAKKKTPLAKAKKPAAREKKSVKVARARAKERAKAKARAEELANPRFHPAYIGAPPEQKSPVQASTVASPAPLRPEYQPTEPATTSSETLLAPLLPREK